MGFFNKTNRRVLCAKNFERQFWWNKHNVLGVGKTPPSLERSLKAATKLSRELPTDLEMESIPLMELSPLVEDIHVKTREASQNTDL